MQQLNINLLPEKKKKFDVKLPSIPIMPIISLLILGGLSYYLFAIVPQGWDDEIAALDQQIQDIKRKKQQRIGKKQSILRDLQNENQQLRDTYESLQKLTGVNKHKWSYVLAHFSKIVPENVWLKSFGYDRSGNVTLSCVGLPVKRGNEIYNYGAIGEFMENINTKSSIFSNPFCSSASLAKMRGQTVVNFAMKCFLKKNKSSDNN